MAPSYAWKKILLLCYFQVACCLAFLGWIPQKFHHGQEAVDEATKEQAIKECVTTFPFPQADHEAFKANRAIDHNQEEEDNYLQKIMDELEQMDEMYQKLDGEKYSETTGLLITMHHMDHEDDEQRYSFMTRNKYFPPFPSPLDKKRALKLYRALREKIEMRLNPPGIDFKQKRRS